MSTLKVYKFGGASIETIERAKKVADIIASHNDTKLIVVVSAKGKTTNALEEIVNLRIADKKNEARDLLKVLELDHLDYAHQLIDDANNDVFFKINELITEIDMVIDEPSGKGNDYYYDQIVSIGELLSTSILHAYLLKQNLKSIWIDARDLIRTDNNYRDANVIWHDTEKLVFKQCTEVLKSNQIIITQGFIGATDENNAVTLGREGSDYTAAILANVMNAESLSIWKDVSSLLNADPKIFLNTIPIPEITFHEVIEMAFYGAQVIHPKTIKPLQNKNIPLYVKCFLDENLQGTKISSSTVKVDYPPIMVLKTKQILLQVNTKDYSFITEDNLSKIYTLFHDCKIKINLIQSAAISFVACIDSHPEKLEALLEKLSNDYEVKRNENLFLFTVRHYTQNVLEEELKNRTVLLTQKTRQTIQMVVR
jgi:aspartate kinase